MQYECYSAYLDRLCYNDSKAMKLRRARPRVLLVDDDPVFVGFVCAKESQLGVSLDVSAAGRDALSRIESSMWAGVLLDLDLPDVSGLDVLRTMRAKKRLVPVVVLTGAADVATAVEAMKLGALACFIHQVL